MLLHLFIAVVFLSALSIVWGWGAAAFPLPLVSSPTSLSARPSSLLFSTSGYSSLLSSSSKPFSSLLSSPSVRRVSLLRPTSFLSSSSKPLHELVPPSDPTDAKEEEEGDDDDDGDEDDAAIEKGWGGGDRVYGEVDDEEEEVVKRPPQINETLLPPRDLAARARRLRYAPHLRLLGLPLSESGRPLDKRTVNFAVQRLVDKYPEEPRKGVEIIGNKGTKKIEIAGGRAVEAIRQLEEEEKKAKAASALDKKGKSASKPDSISPAPSYRHLPWPERLTIYSGGHFKLPLKDEMFDKKNTIFPACVVGMWAAPEMSSQWMQLTLFVSVTNLYFRGRREAPPEMPPADTYGGFNMDGSSASPASPKSRYPAIKKLELGLDVAIVASMSVIFWWLGNLIRRSALNGTFGLGSLRRAIIMARPGAINYQLLVLAHYLSCMLFVVSVESKPGKPSMLDRVRVAYYKRFGPPKQKNNDAADKR